MADRALRPLLPAPQVPDKSAKIQSVQLTPSILLGFGSSNHPTYSGKGLPAHPEFPPTGTASQCSNGWLAQHIDIHDWSEVQTMPSTSLGCQANHTLGSPHSHAYPQEQLSAYACTFSPELPLMLPSYPQLSGPVHEGDPRSTVPTLPSYRRQHSSIPQAPLQRSNASKRPYQLDGVTPRSSPQHSGSRPNPKLERSLAARAEAWIMSDDDRLLLQLKDGESLPWKLIALRFKEMNRGDFRVPTLQMRYKRLKEKTRVWEVEDISYLEQAIEDVEKRKWELISQCMMELGCKKKIPGSTCEKKWKEIEPQYPPHTHPGSTTPSLRSHDTGQEQSRSPEGIDATNNP